MIMVSILCLTYNHKGFIRDAIDGFLMQKTGFEFEILVHDDASTDGTADIIREYARKYPDIIKPYFQTENQFSKAGEYPYMFIYRLARGKYIATCDGDDYWTDPTKLQKQFDFLEANPEYVMCFHDYVTFQNGGFGLPDAEKPKDWTSEELMNYNPHKSGYGIASLDRMYRNTYSPETAEDIALMMPDYPEIVYLGQYGGCKYIPGIKPSVYRRLHGSNTWTGQPTAYQEKVLRERRLRVLTFLEKKGLTEYADRLRGVMNE